MVPECINQCFTPSYPKKYAIFSQIDAPFAVDELIKIQIDFTADKDGKIIEGGYIHSSRLECLYDEDTEFVKTQSLEDWRKGIK